MIDKRLRPCLHCGKTKFDIISTKHNYKSDKWTARILCLGCYSETRNHGFDDTEDKAIQGAIDAWNSSISVDLDLLHSYLSPCPNCRKEENIHFHISQDRRLHWIKCFSCGYVGPKEDNEWLAVQAWNQKVGEYNTKNE